VGTHEILNPATKGISHARPIQQAMFLKNVALVGGVLLLAHVGSAL